MQKNNIKAVVIGFMLIALVAATVYYKSYKEEEKIDLKIYTDSVAMEKELVAKKITPDELLKKIQNNSSIEVVDIRTREEYLKEHLLDSKNIPFLEMESEVGSLDKNKSYVFLDDGMSESAANLVINFLSKNGWAQALYLEGGFSSWKDGYNPIISSGDPESMIDHSKVKYITSEQLRELVDGGQINLILIDIRDAGKFAEGHIQGALNFPLDSLEEKRREIALGKKIVLCGDEDVNIFKGAVRLFDMGFFSVLVLTDKSSTWEQKGFEVIK